MRRLLLASLLFCACRAPPPPACAADPRAVPLAAPLNVTLEVDASVATADAVTLRTALDDWARCATVSLHVQIRPPRRLPVPFPASTEELAGLPPREAAARLMTPLLQLVRAVAPPARHVVVVLLPDVVAPSSAAATVLPELVGLGLPATVDTASEAQPLLSQLPFPRAPLVLASARQLKLATAPQRASALGHEIGHALGLRHDERPCNLMAQTSTCGVGWLDAAQAEIVRASLVR